MSLEKWMSENGVVGLCDIDTRALTRHLRKHGAMAGVIVPEGGAEAVAVAAEPAVVSCSEPTTYGTGRHRVALIDCGCANSVIRELMARDLTVVRLPWDADLAVGEYDGVVVAGGAGDPSTLGKAVESVRAAVAAGRPVLGIGLGNLVVAQAAGAGVAKLKYGHHGHNQPVRERGTDRVPITNQNHLWVAETASMDGDWEVWFENLNDGSCEGIRHRTGPFFAVQFAPDGSIYNLFTSKL
jgi:carbamoyl-phosphate synthase small subunit